MSNQPRVQKGVPTGGQFTHKQQSESTDVTLAPARASDLSQDPVSRQLVRLTDGNWVATDGPMPPGATEGFVLKTVTDGERQSYYVSDGRAEATVDSPEEALLLYADYMETFVEDQDDDVAELWYDEIDKARAAAGEQATFDTVRIGEDDKSVLGNNPVRLAANPEMGAYLLQHFEDGRNFLYIEGTTHEARADEWARKEIASGRVRL